MQQIIINKHYQNTMLINFSKTYSTIDQIPKTAKATYQRQNKSTLQMYKQTNHNTDRPKTSFYLTHRFNPLHSKAVKLAVQSQINSAENELRKIYKVDLSHYLHKKFRNFVIRKHDIVSEANMEYSSIQNPENISHLCSRMKLMDSSQILSQSKYFPSANKAIESAYVVNAKQKISRLIEMKREKEDKFNRLSEGIRSRCQTKEMSKRKNGWKYMAKETIEDKSWDKEWKEQHNHQIQRYKKKVFSRSKVLFPKRASYRADQ